MAVAGRTLAGLTHSAWWESSLVLGMGWSQNSQGSSTASLSLLLLLLSLLLLLLLLFRTLAAVADLLRAVDTRELLVDLHRSVKLVLSSQLLTS